MAVGPGTRVAHYEVAERLGKGGMGEVYRARDTRLDRDVAVKVLPSEWSRDPDRQSRFEREAKLLAALNHPAIATLHGLEEYEEGQVLVMELVPGETLAERLARGAMPLAEVVPLFVAIAEGLEAAHANGIVHRDLKPANLKITADGAPKILDFGLAKALAREDGDGTGSAALDTDSPTLTQGTALGTILGTAPYMSPEQARGKRVDARTDVWAFGCCLYEALSGRRAFTGETTPDVITAVLGKEPDWDALPPDTPPRLELLLRRLLRKEPRLRLQHVGDARIELLELGDEPGARPEVSTRRPLWSLLATAAVAALLSGLAVWITTDAPPASPNQSVVRMTIRPPEGEHLPAPTGYYIDALPTVTISRDGATIAYVAERDGASRIYLRELDSLQVRPIEGTDNGRLPFLSFESDWLGFSIGDSLWRVSLDGGLPLEIGKLPGDARGAVWLPDGSIVAGGANRGLLHVDAEDGSVSVITRPDSSRGEQYHAWPFAMPDGEHVLFTAVTGNGSDLGVLSLGDRSWRLIPQTSEASQPFYLDSGHLVFYRRGGALFVAPFSASSLELEGPPVQFAGKVLESFNAGLNLGHYAVSSTGTLVHVPGDVDTQRRQIVRVARDGTAQPVSTPDRYGYLAGAISPDGRRLVVTDQIRSSGDLLVLDLERRSRIRLTHENANIWPVWNRDGSQVIFALFGDVESFDLYSMRADGGDPEPLLVRPHDQSPTSISRDGRLLLFNERHPETRGDIHILPLDKSGEAYAFLATPDLERDGSFSADGRYIAYVSDETGQPQVYVRPLAGDAGKVPISNDGGEWPRWSPRGDELFYMHGQELMRVPVVLEPSIQAGIPEPLFSGNYAAWFDVFPDGQSFAMLELPQIEIESITVTVNWAHDLAARAASP